MKIFKNNRGFTLIELLLVIGIVAIILAVIVPMGIRANIDAKYGVVRQNCSELASFASQWAEKSIQAQDEQRSLSTLKHYYASLAASGGNIEPPTTSDGALAGQWISNQEANNWNLTDGTTRDPETIFGRIMNNDGPPVEPEDVVEDIIPPDKTIRNPFTQVSVFRAPNDPIAQAGVVNGAVAFGAVAEFVEDGNPWVYYAFAFQGTDSTTIDIADGDAKTTFHAGMGLDSVAKIRNAVFAGRFR